MPRTSPSTFVFLNGAAEIETVWRFFPSLGASARLTTYELLLEALLGLFLSFPFPALVVPFPFRFSNYWVGWMGQA